MKTFQTLMSYPIINANFTFSLHSRVQSEVVKLLPVYRLLNDMYKFKDHTV